MTIREVLEANWTVKHFEVTVRDKDGRCICTYLIGKDTRLSRYAKFKSETAAGDIYYDNGRKIMVIDKNIQFRNQEHKPKGKEMCVGVLTEVIPNEILDLSIYHMRPVSCGWSNEQHGYSFDCIVNFWGGIPGEHEQMEMKLWKK